MIVDYPIIRGISDSNPIQFWSPDKLTFNQTTIKGVDKKYYYQKFDFNESLYMRLDVAFNTHRYEPWDIGATYNIGDRVYDTATLTRWISNIDTNVGNEPNPVSPAPPSVVWDHDPLIGDPVAWLIGTTYNSGDRVRYYSGLGTPQRIAESLAEANLGNQPNGYLGTLWDQVQEPNGYFQLRIYVDGGVVGSLDFADIKADSTHQFVTWLWSTFPETEGKTVYLDIFDVQNAIVLAVSDCFQVVSDDYDPSVTVQYNNSDDVDGIVYEDVNPTFYIRLKAHFYEETHPVDYEDHKLSQGRIISLRKEMVTKRLLRIIEYMPDFMHKKVRRILLHDNIVIDDLQWKCQDEYQRSIPEASTLSAAQVLLTDANSILVNISRGGGDNIFSEEFSHPPFA